MIVSTFSMTIRFGFGSQNLFLKHFFTSGSESMIRPYEPPGIPWEPLGAILRRSGSLSAVFWPNSRAFGVAEPSPFPPEMVKHLKKSNLIALLTPYRNGASD